MNVSLALGGTPYTALMVGGRSLLYSIDLNTGRATAVGPIGTGTVKIVGLAVSSPGQVSFSLTGTTAPENAGAFQITVNRTGGADGLVTVDYGTADGTARAGLDYAPTFGTLVFQEGETSKTISIPILNDNIIEGPETLGVGLGNPTGGAALGTVSTAGLTITDVPGTIPGNGPGPGPTTPIPGGTTPIPGTNQPRTNIFVTGADAGGGPHVKVFAANGTLVAEFFAFDPRFTGGVRVAAGDVNGDGFPDVICAAGPGGGPNVIVISGRDHTPIFNFFAYYPAFTGGVYVAAGDVNGDGFADIVCGADAGGGPHVMVYSGRDTSPLTSFFAYDPAFTGGVRVSAGDVNGDGRAEIIAGAGAGGGPNVTVYTYVGGAPRMIQSYFAFDPAFTAGIFVGAGDVNGDRRADVIAGTGALTGVNFQLVSVPSVAVFNGADATQMSRFAVSAPPFAGATRVASTDLAGSGRASVIAVRGPGGSPEVGIFDGITGQLIDSFFAYDPNFTGGLYVANSVR